MTKQIGNEISGFFRRLANQPGATLTESIQSVRVDNVNHYTPELVDELKAIASKVEQLDLGLLELFGDVAGRLGIAEMEWDDIEGESLTIILEKTSQDDRCFFFSQKGFKSWLEGLSVTSQNVSDRKCIEITDDFSEFSTFLFTVKQFGSPRTLPDFKQAPEKPGKLVRDFTQRFTPQYIDPWLLIDKPAKTSESFRTWSGVAIQRLVYCLPTEIRAEGSDAQVFFRGGRSLPISIDKEVVWDEVNFELIYDVCEWVYSTPREAETKFQLLNNHVGINWSLEEAWPSGTNHLLPNSFAGAKEAFSFHLQEQSKEAVKSLGDLRKGLQEEVNKTQSATRDLVAALWRDFAVAGVVAALKAPILPNVIPDISIKALQIGVSALLFLSILVSTISNWKFNSLADCSRRNWRKKLYSFMSDADWKSLVEKPISSGRTVYWVSWSFCLLLYLTMIRYFLGLAIPDVVANYVDRPFVLLYNFICAVLSYYC
ncbi:hypothetical protein GGD92_02110 [Pseudomonas protegens]|uniref:Uncharacterized protein n=1 Tax=Pseudomonas protegens TaxID=380021 RepID=A0A7G7XAW0_9PSED|nr:hypothetical protein [Pseudomonas protegens]QNH77105.1 hypothetical protein GGI48_28245 [Pseudomonas protegens]QNL06300.1 hypothetical protein GGD92_02110 [Pseudomonas protegens]